MSIKEASDRFRKYQTNNEEKSNHLSEYQFYKAMGLIDRPQVIEDDQVYESLVRKSQQSFFLTFSEEYHWLEGYPIGITPIKGKEQIYLIEFSLENGHFLLHPFALAKGLDLNYQQLLLALGGVHVDEHSIGNILMKKCIVSVSSKVENGESSYVLHEVLENFKQK